MRTLAVFELILPACSFVCSPNPAFLTCPAHSGPFLALVSGGTMEVRHRGREASHGRGNREQATLGAGRVWQGIIGRHGLQAARRDRADELPLAEWSTAVSGNSSEGYGATARRRLPDAWRRLSTTKRRPRPVCFPIYLFETVPLGELHRRALLVATLPWRGSGRDSAAWRGVGCPADRVQSVIGRLRASARAQSAASS
jgi:hypothetical protein